MLARFEKTDRLSLIDCGASSQLTPMIRNGELRQFDVVQLKEYVSNITGGKKCGCLLAFARTETSCLLASQSDHRAAVGRHTRRHQRSDRHSCGS